MTNTERINRPGLAEGLGLSRGYGVMISDVVTDSPADDAGLQPRDIITAVDGASVSALPYYSALMYLHDPSLPVAVTVLRGDRTLQFKVPAVAVDDRDYKDILFKPQEGLVPELGIFGKTLNSSLALRNGLRSTKGIFVAATTARNEEFGIGLVPGDVIASVNSLPVASTEQLRGAIHDLRGDKPAVFQIERNSQFLYIERELEQRPSEPGADRDRDRR